MKTKIILDKRYVLHQEKIINKVMENIDDDFSHGKRNTIWHQIFQDFRELTKPENKGKLYPNSLLTQITRIIEQPYFYEKFGKVAEQIVAVFDEKIDKTDFIIYKGSKYSFKETILDLDNNEILYYYFHDNQGNLSDRMPKVEYTKGIEDITEKVAKKIRIKSTVVS